MKITRIDWIYIIITIVATLLISLAGSIIIGFPILRPDSNHYLVVIDILRGNLSPSNAVPPFCYRPLMPIIVSLVPGDSIIVWTTITLVLNSLIAPVTYFLIREFDVDSFGAFVGTGLTTVNWISAAYGICVLTDVPAMLSLAVALLLIKRGERASLIIPVIVIGTLCKEVAILAAVAWLFRAILQRNRRGFIEGSIAMALSAAAYLAVRGIWSLIGVQPDWYWQWNNLYNFVVIPEVVIKTFWLGFMFWLPAIIVAVIVLWKDYQAMRPKFEWILYLSPFLLLLFAGLFMAYFSLRFVWPLYFALAPAAGYAAEWTWNHIISTIRTHSWFKIKFNTRESEDVLSREN
ncbi:MAG: hypothetical protein K9W43_07020 [Candidatus Thorarchaeota archaeon]|nr:hypothetical protein [Candidatus Thorarchaeota archaeon]